MSADGGDRNQPPPPSGAGGDKPPDYLRAESIMDVDLPPPDTASVAITINPAPPQPVASSGPIPVPVASAAPAPSPPRGSGLFSNRLGGMIQPLQIDGSPDEKNRPYLAGSGSDRIRVPLVKDDTLPPGATTRTPRSMRSPSSGAVVATRSSPQHAAHFSHNRPSSLDISSAAAVGLASPDNSAPLLALPPGSSSSAAPPPLAFAIPSPNTGGSGADVPFAVPIVSPPPVYAAPPPLPSPGGGAAPTGVSVTGTPTAPTQSAHSNGSSSTDDWKVGMADPAGKKRANVISPKRPGGSVSIRVQPIGAGGGAADEIPAPAPNSGGQAKAAPPAAPAAPAGPSPSDIAAARGRKAIALLCDGPCYLVAIKIPCCICITPFYLLYEFFAFILNTIWNAIQWCCAGVVWACDLFCDAVGECLGCIFKTLGYVCCKLPCSVCDACVNWLQDVCTKCWTAIGQCLEATVWRYCLEPCFRAIIACCGWTWKKTVIFYGYVYACMSTVCGALWGCMQIVGGAIFQFFAVICGAIWQCVSFCCTKIYECMSYICGLIFRCLTVVCTAIFECMAYICSKLYQCVSAICSFFAMIGRAVYDCLAFVCGKLYACISVICGAVADCLLWVHRAICVPIWECLSTICGYLYQCVSWCCRKIADCLAAIWSCLSVVGSAIWSCLSVVGAAIWSCLTVVYDAFAACFSAIGDCFSAIGKMIYENVMAPIGRCFSAIADAVGSFFTAVGNICR